jgi:hypothetical protein
MSKKESLVGTSLDELFQGTFLETLQIPIPTDQRLGKALGEVAEGEKIIGLCTEIEKRICICADFYRKETLHAIIASKPSVARAFAKTASVLNDLRWALIRWRLCDVISTQSIGIREDYAIVAIENKLPEEEQTDFERFLSALLKSAVF